MYVFDNVCIFLVIEKVDFCPTGVVFLELLCGRLRQIYFLSIILNAWSLRLLALEHSGMRQLTHLSPKVEI